MIRNFLTLLFAASVLAQAPLNRRLYFDYTTEITPSMGAHVFSSTNVTAPLDTWTYLGSVTNLAPTNSVSIQLKWREEFFVIGVSNEYTIGGLSNMVFSEVLTSLPPTSARRQAIR